MVTNASNDSSRKPRILVGCDFYAPHWTGIVKSIVNLVKALQDKFDFTIVTVRYIDSLPYEEQSGGARILREDFAFQLSRACYSWKVIWRFLKEVRHNDTVFLNSPCSNILPFALIAKLFGKRIFIFHQGDLVLPRGVMNRVVERVFYVATLIAMALADQVSTYARDYGEQSTVIGHFLPKFKDILMPIYLAPKKDPPSSKIQPLIDLKSKGKIIFGFAGRFVEEKGFDILFAAVPEVVKRIPNAHFVFAGDTQISYEKTFEESKGQIEALKDHVTLLGLLDDAELAWFYHEIELIVVPSRTDCCPLVQMEACLAGRPSVCADIPGAGQIVRQSKYGLLFRKEDSKDLADKLVQAYQQRESFAPQYAAVKEMFDLEMLKGKFSGAFLGR